MQYIYTMIGVSKVVPPKREIIKDISLSFFPGAKIGLLGLNGSGKSTVLRIMAGVDSEFNGEARPQPGIQIGYLPQEPQLDPDKTVREAVEEGLSEILDAQKRLEEVYAAYAEDGADFDKLAAEQQRLENILAAGDAHTVERQLEVAADALRLPPWDAKIGTLVRRREAPRRAVPPAAVQARHAAAGRTDQPPRRRIGGVAGTFPGRVSRHRGRGHPRSLLPRQRGRMDPGTRPRPRHSVEGQLLRRGWNRRMSA